MKSLSRPFWGLILILAFSAVAGASQPQTAPQRPSQPRARVMASETAGPEVERFSANPFDCLSDNEKIYRQQNGTDPTPEQREQWIESCSSSGL